VTTDSTHGRLAYPNLITDVSLTRIIREDIASAQSLVRSGL